MALPSPGGNTVAVKYLGLVPSIQGFEKNIGRELAGSAVTSQASSAGKSLGSRLASSITSTLKTGLKVGAVITGALAAVTVKGGLTRALGIEDARAQLDGLGHDTSAVEGIMKNALASVEGTAFGLDAAATTAAGAVAAGIKPGAQLEQTLKTVANTAAGAKAPMEEIGGIFNTVAAVGKAYTGDINMIAQRGIPIWQSLSSQLGVTQEEVQKMASEGKISFEMFEAAARDAAGGVADSMGQTTRGTFANMMAAVNRLGATFVTGLLPLAKTTFEGITGLVDAVNAKVGPFVEAFFDRFGGGMDAGIAGFFDGLIARVEAFDPTPVMNFFTEVEGGIRAFGAAWAANDGDITSSGFPGFMEQAAYWIRQVWDEISSIDFSSFEAFTSSLTGLDFSGLDFSAFTGSGGGTGIGQALVDIAAASPALIGAGLEVLATALGFVADHADTIVPLLPLLVAGFLAYQAATSAAASATNALFAADLISLPLQITRNITSQQAAVARFRAAMATRAEVTADAAKQTSTIRATVAERARTIATNLGSVASRAAAIATRAFGAALRFATGPIGLIITGVTLLVGALVYFFTQTETGQKLWSKIWGWIKDAAAAVVSWFTDTALPILQAAWDGIAAGALWLYENAILPAWNGIQTAIGVVGNWITNTLWPAIQTAWDAIAAGATWLYENVILPVWTAIRIAIAVVVTAIGLYIDFVIFMWKNVFAPVVFWLYESVILPVWNAIRGAISAVVDWIVNVGWPALKLTFELIGAAAVWLYENAILPAWNWIKDAVAAVVDWLVNTAWPAIQTAWDAIAAGATWLYEKVILPVWNAILAAIDVVVQWLRNTAWPLIETVIGWLQLSFEGWKLIAQTVWDAVMKAVDTVVSWFRDTAWPIVSDVIERLKSGFETMRDRISDVWDGIKNKIINPVATWFRDTIQPMITRVTDGIEDSFNTMQEAVQKAWEKVRDTAKVPVKFVIEDIVRDGIVAKYNEVAKVFRVPEIDTDRFTVGWARGGHTGHGRKHDVAGVVHADEYVLQKSSQRSLAKAAPGFLDDLNQRGAKALEKIGYGYASGGWVKPFRGSYGVNSPYGMRGGRLHAGVDFPTPRGTPMTAVSDGTIVGRGYNSAAGNKISLATDMQGIVAGYHHLSRFAASLGDKVSKGDVIGYSGNTGRSTGPHLHFSIKRDGSYVNPSPYLAGAGIAGDGSGGGWNPFAGIWDSLKDRLREGVGEGPFADMLFEMPKKMLDGAVSWATDKLAALGDWASDTADAIGGRARWTPVATQALTMKGEFGPLRLNSLLRRMGQESSFNPNAVNNWDSNARAGNSSRGLMQVIPSTFRAYAEPGYDRDIFDPLSNILASINYTLARYGSLRRGWDRSGGYAEGGHVTPTLYDSGGRLQPGISVIANKTNRPETILPPEESAALTKIARRTGDGTVVNYNNTVHAEPDSAKELVDELMWEQKLAERKHRGKYAKAGR